MGDGAKVTRGGNEVEELDEEVGWAVVDEDFMMTRL